MDERKLWPRVFGPRKGMHVARVENSDRYGCSTTFGVFRKLADCRSSSKDVVQRELQRVIFMIEYLASHERIASDKRKTKSVDKGGCSRHQPTPSNSNGPSGRPGHSANFFPLFKLLEPDTHSPRLARANVNKVLLNQHPKALHQLY